jgi:SAM-dependent methyltransferase
MILHEDQTRQLGDDFKVNAYYDRAEKDDWLTLFWNPKLKFRQLFDGLNTNTIVELACGHGRHTARILDDTELINNVEHIYPMDINSENISFCEERFKGYNSVTALTNNGYDFHPLERESVTAIFCYDAMVHFEYDAVISYVEDAFRVLRSGGRALLHHSNYDKSPGANWISNPCQRNFMSKNLFSHIAIRAGFNIIEQVLIDWDDYRRLDCISLIEKREARDSITSTDSKPSRLSGRVFHKLARRKMKDYLGI